MKRTRQLGGIVGLLLLTFVGGNVVLTFAFGYPAIFRTPFVTEDGRRRFWASMSLFANEHSLAATPSTSITITAEMDSLYMEPAT